MGKVFIIIASISGFLAVSLGAFGAHLLKQKLSADLLDIYQTAVSYHFYHTAALLACGVLLLQYNDSVLLRSSGWLFVFGTVVFSGSLYLLSLSGVRWLGAITPIGGFAFLLAWGCLAMGIYRAS